MEICSIISLILLGSGFIVAQEKQMLCRSSNAEVSYSSCGSSTETLVFGLEPCNLNDFTKWKATIFWIPKRDLTFLRMITALWHEHKKVLEWRNVICTGEDDDYTFCGALKGETINTTLGIRSKKASYPLGEYIVILKGYFGHFEADLLLCMNFTLILKKEPSYNFG